MRRQIITVTPRAKAPIAVASTDIKLSTRGAPSCGTPYDPTPDLELVRGWRPDPTVTSDLELVRG
ncbi:hypothetical protein Aglo01_06460 [Actinokineospora globicatena]|nr:hypothetical protein Aglo01_06460 [Actinokineospora globicatena]GLW83000.1 hypothetical protein Aglo02_06400 [Actinokineospora globicatena]